MDYKELTQIVDAEVKRSLGGTLTPERFQDQPSKDVFQRVYDFYKKVTGNASTFGSIINIGSKRVKGGQYAVIEFTPPTIEAAGDDLVFKGTYEKDGMIFLCYHPQSGDWKKANEAKQEDIDEEIANSEGLLAQANAAEAENPEEQTTQSEEQETIVDVPYTNEEQETSEEQTPQSEGSYERYTDRTVKVLKTISKEEAKDRLKEDEYKFNGWVNSTFGHVNPAGIEECLSAIVYSKREPNFEYELRRYQPKEQPKKQSFISKASNSVKQGVKNLYDQMSNEEV